MRLSLFRGASPWFLALGLLETSDTESAEKILHALWRHGQLERSLLYLGEENVLPF